MSDKTGIEWTDATWNPTLGCSRVSEGCRHCYAEVQAQRIIRMGKGKPTPYDGLVKLVDGEARWTGKVVLAADRLTAPLRWRSPRRVFVNSMSDLFHERLTNVKIAAVFGVMAAAPQHTFQILTKRAKRMREWFEWIDGGADTPANLCRLHADDALTAAGLSLPERSRLGIFNAPPEWPLPNVWLGTSVENQAAADERIPELLATAAAVRFLSCEPLIEPINISSVVGQWWLDNERDPELHWIIAGCESGPGARPAEVDWYRSLRDQCAAAGVAFFLKQAVGEAAEVCDQGCRQLVRIYVSGPTLATYSCGCTVEGGEDGSPPSIGAGEGSHRKPGGVIGAPYLDGVQHLAFPKSP